MGFSVKLLTFSILSTSSLMSCSSYTGSSLSEKIIHSEVGQAVSATYMETRDEQIRNSIQPGSWKYPWWNPDAPSMIPFDGEDEIEWGLFGGQHNGGVAYYMEATYNGMQESRRTDLFENAGPVFASLEFGIFAAVDVMTDKPPTDMDLVLNINWALRATDKISHQNVHIIMNHHDLPVRFGGRQSRSDRISMIKSISPFGYARLHCRKPGERRFTAVENHPQNYFNNTCTRDELGGEIIRRPDVVACAKTDVDFDAISHNERRWYPMSMALTAPAHKISECDRLQLSFALLPGPYESAAIQFGNVQVTGIQR